MASAAFTGIPAVFLLAFPKSGLAPLQILGAHVWEVSG
jgi:hypothetical protein